MEEIWKDVPEYEGHYQVSNKGGVRSFKAKNGTIRYLNPKPSNSGYPRVSLSKNANVSYKHVHKLMALAFLENPNNYRCINHKNGIKTDNRIENIEWCSYSENNKHAYDNGLKTPEDYDTTKLTSDEVIQMRNTYRLGCFTYREIADAFDISHSHCWGIINKNYWKHV